MKVIILEGFGLIYKGDFPKFSACGGLSVVILEGFSLLWKGDFQNFSPAALTNTLFRGEVARRRRKILAFWTS